MKIVILDTGTMGEDMEFSSIERLGECVIYNNTSKEATDDVNFITNDLALKQIANFLKKET